MAFNITLLLLFSSLFHLLMAVARLLVRPLTSRSLYLCAIFFLVAWSLLHGYATLSGDIRYVPHLLYSHLPAFFLLGPVSYRWLKTLVGERATAQGFLIECIPAAAATAFLIPVYVLPVPQKLAIAESFISNGQIPLQGRVILGAGMLIYAVYLIRSASILAPYMTIRNLRREKSAFIAAIVLAYALVLTIGTGLSIFGHRQWFPFVMYALAVFAPALFLLGARFPDFFAEFQQVVERGKYEVTRLAGKDMDRIQSELDRLMQEERLFEEGRLTLEELAERVALTPHALSEFLNLHRETNFAGYVNSFRVERACGLIEQDPTRTVLSVAFEVGFTAKSTFNSAFLRHKGVTPTEFRQSARKKKR